MNDPARPDPTRVCRSCDGAKQPRMYLCTRCWFCLPKSTRLALTQRGPAAVRRLAELHEQLQAGTALHQIRITA